MTIPATTRKRAAPEKRVNAATVKSKATAPGATTATAKLKPNPPAVAQAAQNTKVKHKLVRDSFTIPKAEYAVLEALKARATNLKRPAKKGELLRSGIAALQCMSDKAFLSALARIPSLKTGRPKGPESAARTAKNSAE